MTKWPLSPLTNLLRNSQAMRIARIMPMVYIEKMKLPAKAVPLLNKASTIPLEDVSAFYKEIGAKVDPTTKRAEVYLNLGTAYVAQKKFAGAFAAYNKAIEFNDDAEAHYRLADAYLKAGKYNNAIQSAQRAFGSKYHVPAHVVAGGAYEKLRPEGWKDKAIGHYQKGLKDRRYQKHCEDMIHRIRNPMGEAEEG